MAQNISITPEGWKEIYDACHISQKKFLLEAINETAMQIGIEAISEEAAIEISQAALANIVFEIVKITNKCDDDGACYWIDPKGLYKIDLQLRR